MSLFSDNATFSVFENVIRIRRTFYMHLQLVNGWLESDLFYSF